MKYIYRNGGFTVSMMEDEPVAALKNETARCLMDAIDTTRISERIPEDMLRKLREDIFVFSGCKSYHELEEASQLLLDEEFRIKPFQRFRQDVLDIYPKYNQRYLEAEY